MAVNKRLRFEVLRRDGYACHYCHCKDIPLTVDHVVPQALGGRDEAENLVACCMECNSGKSSINPDEPLVAQVSEEATRFHRLLKIAIEDKRVSLEDERAYCDNVLDMWESITSLDDEHCFPLPDSWRSSARYWAHIDVPDEYLRYAFEIAREKCDMKRLPRYKAFNYASGIIGNLLDGVAIDLRKRMEGDTDAHEDHQTGDVEQ
ncbi:HNH endonuclease [Bifidobacterium pseudocatenulatum]|jgi:hypothetical protein|uniref:HNH endonuclease n=1 Tax=Bifidobacterium pseudocatenulatum TaxID=28026 RepID=UPI000E42ED84|nr:HNH endonuclease [Bifidobacterium pseudocatenulatum]GDZ04288.1 hypothetical protein MCC01992_15870 [Bifidobacteriaceae bacterium MCC01992]MCB4866280.1 HNH endonuclease [Bifidobacterium pseudocatenulatum]RGJ10476.1 HNH endonuclease [Bifidobacterium pseudocatenulatum]RGJ86587.1 HNH endonuclease [Bifidobacterium pseudocatenulatum]RGN30032.1 HNH endonuclease [Bifidobacterium pseudocatenulatum]